MCKILLLSGHDIDVLKENNLNVDICNVYKNGIIYKLAKRNRFLINFSFDTWKKNIKTYDIVIIFDTYYNDGFINYIYKKNPHTRIIFYCWNTIKTIADRINVEPLFKDKRIEMWSYNKNDCEKYNMKYNPQFWNKQLISTTQDDYIGISFIGSQKKRINYLEDIYQYCKSNNLKTYFYVTGYKGEFNKNKTEEFMPYDKYITEIAINSHAILDLVNDENYGLTLRPLEALFLKKKLITNYYDIINENFYSPNNIYLLGKEKRSIKDFLIEPYCDINDDIIDYYDCTNWIKRFKETK